MSHRVSWRGDCRREEVGSFEIRTGKAVGVPGGDEGGSCEPAPNSHISSWKEKEARPTHKNKSITFEPVIESIKDIEPVSR